MTTLRLILLSNRPWAVSFLRMWLQIYMLPETEEPTLKEATP